MPIDAHGTAWYAVQVKRQSEHRVAWRLGMTPVSTFLPLMESVRRRHRGGVTTRLEPLFPGYLFVQMQAVEVDPHYWHIVRWTPGVRRILGTDETPVPMPSEAIEALQIRVQELGFVRPGVRFAPGSRVRIRSGPLVGLEAIFERPTSKKGRVRVLLELLGQVGPAEVDESSLDAA